MKTKFVELMMIVMYPFKFLAYLMPNYFGFGTDNNFMNKSLGT
jgi:hypothetical protein